MDEILPGLYHWTAQHPNLGRPVSSHYLAEGRVALDPMVPTEGLEAFDGMGVEHVVLSCRHHARHHDRFVEAFDAVFHVPEAGVHEYEGEDLEGYGVGDEPAPGVKAVANGPIAPDDTVLLLDVEGGALLFADSLVNKGGDQLAYVPDGLLGDDPDQVRADITDRLRELCDQRFEHLLFAHGDPVVGGGHEALERFVAEQENAR
jgi:hypothetical protein